MKGFAKFIRILFMILGISMSGAITAMLFLDTGLADDPNLIMPAWAAYTILILVDIFCVFLFVYNIICLHKGIDVFFWLIFRHQRYVNGEYKKDYNKKKYTSTPKPTPTTSSGSYSKDSTPKSYGGTTNFDKLNAGPSSSGGGKSGHQFGWADISNVVKSVGRNQIWLFNAYVSVGDVYVKEDGDYDFRIEVEFKVTGNATIKDSVDASRFKSRLADSQKALFQEIEDALYPKYQKYGFGYEIKVTRCDTSGLKVTNY